MRNWALEPMTADEIKAFEERVCRWYEANTALRNHGLGAETGRTSALAPNSSNVPKSYSPDFSNTTTTDTYRNLQEEWNTAFRLSRNVLEKFLDAVEGVSLCPAHAARIRQVCEDQENKDFAKNPGRKDDSSKMF